MIIRQKSTCSPFVLRSIPRTKKNILQALTNTAPSKTSTPQAIRNISRTEEEYFELGSNKLFV